MNIPTVAQLIEQLSRLDPQMPVFLDESSPVDAGYDGEYVDLVSVLMNCSEGKLTP